MNHTARIRLIRNGIHTYIRTSHILPDHKRNIQFTRTVIDTTDPDHTVAYACIFCIGDLIISPFDKNVAAVCRQVAEVKPQLFRNNRSSLILIAVGINRDLRRIYICQIVRSDRKRNRTASLIIAFSCNNDLCRSYICVVPILYRIIGTFT